MKKLKRLLFILLLLICNNCFAQGDTNKDYERFVKKFTTIIFYPGQLKASFKPTVCLIKIQVDSAKNILDMQLSDSADSTLKVEFNKHKGELDTKPLISYFKSEYSNNNCTTYIIPLSFAMYYKQVPNQVISIKSLYDYSRYNGNNLNGNVIWLGPIYTEGSIPKR